MGEGWLDRATGWMDERTMGPILQRRSAEQLGPTLSPDAFRAGLAGTVEASPGGTTPLPPVQCWLGGASIEQHAVPVQRPLGMPDQGPGLLEAVRFPPLRITRLHGAVCVPGGVVLAGDTVLAECFSASWEAYQHRHLTADGDGWRLAGWPGLTAQALPALRGPVLYLDHQHIDWFGHVLLDLLAPAWAFGYGRAYLGLAGLRVLCSRSRHAFVQELLDAAGMDGSVVAPIEAPVRCDDLIVATKAFQIQEYISPPAVRFFRAMSVRQAGTAPPSSGRIYVSRARNPTRRLAEEAAVEALLRRHGFEVFHPELFDIATQIRVFAGAELIAGCSGSNMFGLAFRARARAILVFVSPLLIHYSEQLLHACRDEGALTMVIGSVRADEMEAAPGDVHCTWHVDMTAVEGLVAAWVGAHAG